MLIPIQQLKRKLPRTDFHTNESRPEVEWHALFHSQSRSFLIVCFCVCVCVCVGSRDWVASAVTHTLGTRSVRVICWANTSMARGSNASESCDLPRNLSDTFDEVVNRTSNRAARFKFTLNRTLSLAPFYVALSLVGSMISVIAVLTLRNCEHWKNFVIGHVCS